MNESINNNAISFSNINSEPIPTTFPIIFQTTMMLSLYMWLGFALVVLSNLLVEPLTLEAFGLLGTMTLVNPLLLGETVEYMHDGKVTPILNPLMKFYPS